MTQDNNSTLTGLAAIECAERTGASINKHADPTEGAREGLSIDDAREIAREDASLLWVRVTASTPLRCVSDTYDQDGGTYDDVADFLRMCDACFGERPDLTEHSGSWYEGGTLVLEPVSEGTAYAEQMADGWRVVDPDDGVWWPSDEAEAEIQASDDPAATAVRIATQDPMRGEWHSGAA